jgi:hypothetical protein
MSVSHISCSQALSRGILLLGGCSLLAGCVYHYTHTGALTEALAIRATNPERFFIRVPNNGDYPIPADGRVRLRYTENAKSWELKCMDGILCDHTSRDVEAIYIMEGKRVVKKVSLYPPEKFLRNYPADEQGYRLITLDQK